MSQSANEAPTLPNSEEHEQPVRVRRSGGFDVFVSFDSEHDGELCDRILAESRMPGAGFTVLGASSRSPATEASQELTRRRIEKADQVIVLCGEHTDESLGVFRELKDAQRAEKPYVMLWGRRDVMCSKPQGARSADGMFSWTPQILQEQLGR